MANKTEKRGLKSYYLRIPDTLHRALVKQAERDHRSLAQEIIHLLERAVAQSDKR